MSNTLNEPFQGALRLRGNLYGGMKYFRTNVETGASHNADGDRVCALTDDFLLGFRDALMYEVGQSYGQVMKQCGRTWGKQFANKFLQKLQKEYNELPAELGIRTIVTCLSDAFTAHGWGRLSIQRIDEDAATLVIVLQNSILPDLVIESDQHEDFIWTGFFAAFWGVVLGKTLDAVQIECVTRNGRFSRFVVAPKEDLEKQVAFVQSETFENGQEVG
ncbi:MAG: hypothetical protein R3B84_08560 [Zavarzinella sp.]